MKLKLKDDVQLAEVPTGESFVLDGEYYQKTNCLTSDGRILCCPHLKTGNMREIRTDTYVTPVNMEVVEL